jgi:hypothetical protein
LIAAITSLLKNGDKESLEHRIVLPDGSERIVFQQAEAKRDAQGRVILCG